MLGISGKIVREKILSGKIALSKIAATGFLISPSFGITHSRLFLAVNC